MPSDFNHIDDFFRRKEGEIQPDRQLQDAHWQQMQSLIGAGSVPGTSTIIKKSAWFWGSGAVLIIGVVAAIWLINRKTPGKQQNHFTAAVPVKQPEADPSSNIGKATTDSLALYDQSMVIQKGPASPFTNTQTNPIVTSSVAANSVAIQTSPGQKNIRDSFPVGKLKSSDPSFPPNDQYAISFFEQLRKTAQAFSITNTRDTIITGTEGTQLMIPSGAFALPDGLTSAASITIKLREFYSLSDIITHDLYTVSNTQPLVTGGMIHLEAFAGEAAVHLATGKTIELRMPASKMEPGMQLFTGHQIKFSSIASGDSRIAEATSSVNWIPTAQQAAWRNPQELIEVLDLANDPREVNRKGKKRIAKFILSEDSRLSLEEARKELQKKYGKLYDEIHLRRGWKRIRNTNGQAQRSDLTSIDGLVGEKVYMPAEEAVQLGLITAEERNQQKIVSRRMSGISIDSLSMQDHKIESQYGFRISGMGWINCDRFLNFPGSRANLVVDLGDAFRETYFRSFLVFKKFNSILPGNWSHGKVRFAGMPEGEMASVICIGIRDNKAYYFTREIEIGEKELKNIDLVETTPADFQEKLKRFGSVISR